LGLISDNGFFGNRGCRPFSRNVQTPSGPLKSGSPDSVEIPAPVKAIKYLELVIALITSSKPFIDGLIPITSLM
jgi:hypothetical protein